ncbi:MAG: hypothetical protein RIC03_14855 [Cyclobacteriaceae bacterium]
MKRTIKFLPILMALFLLTGCFDDPGTDILFDDSFVELEAATTGSGGRDFTFTRLNDGTTYSAGFMINRADASAAQAVNVTYEVDAASTAIDGIHYTSAGTSVTIPAGEWTAELPFTILADGIEAGERLTIIVNLVSADIPVNESFASAPHTIQISCPSDLGGTYTSVATGDVGDGAGGSSGAWGPVTTEITVTSVGEILYTFSDISFGLYAGVYGIDAPAGNLQDICGTLTGVNTADQYADPFTINATVDGTNGVISLTWANTWGDTGSVVLTPVP